MSNKILIHSVLKHPTLRRRILFMFILLAAVPAVFITLFSTFFFRYVTELWFDKKVDTALNESVQVATAYLKEHQEFIKIRAKAMAMEIDNNIIKYDLTSNKKLFTDVVSSLSDLNSLSEAVIFYNRDPIVVSKLGVSLSFENLPTEYYHKAMADEIVLIPELPNKIRAMVMLHSIPDSFLVVGKYIDDSIVNHINKSKDLAEKYKHLKGQVLEAEFRFILIFILLSLLVLSMAIYAGARFSSSIVKPILLLEDATKRLQAGDFSVKVQEGANNDEVSNLSKAFNSMTERISAQRQKLKRAYNEIDEKRKFNDAVLSGVSTGIIVLSKEKKVKLVNDAAIKLLQLKQGQIIDKSIEEIMPECLELIEKGSETYTNMETEMKVVSKNNVLTLFVKVVVELENTEVIDYIITFDDMTQLVQAQRYSAWSDVARRIAHEVKNPLTPIRLGTERLNNKYANQVDDPTTFKRYTNTIIKHVTDIGRIIEEFSRFARMPAPVFSSVNLSEVLQEIVFSRKCVVTQISYTLEVQDEINLLCDPTQINQLFINILKNSEESIESTEHFEKGEGLIEISVKNEKNYANISIRDNGKGFENSLIEKVTEPYFTTKEKGSGIGLAVVKKIVDDHNGKLIIKNDDSNFAAVTILLPLTVAS